MFKILQPINEEKITIQTLKNGKKRKHRSVVTTGYTEKGPFKNYDEACEWIHKNTSHSFYSALHHQGYRIIETSEL